MSTDASLEHPRCLQCERPSQNQQILCMPGSALAVSAVAAALRQSLSDSEPSPSPTGTGVMPVISSSFRTITKQRNGERDMIHSKNVLRV
jgi:hypothetical protein